MLRIRLSKIGRNNSPAYRIVVAEKRTHQRGKIIDFLGFFDPQNPRKSEFNAERLSLWEGKGAQVSESVRKIMAKEYQFKKYNPALKPSSQ